MSYSKGSNTFKELISELFSEFNSGSLTPNSKIKFMVKASLPYKGTTNSLPNNSNSYDHLISIKKSHIANDLSLDIFLTIIHEMIHVKINEVFYLDGIHSSEEDKAFRLAYKKFESEYKENSSHEYMFNVVLPLFKQQLQELLPFVYTSQQITDMSELTTHSWDESTNSVNAINNSFIIDDFSEYFVNDFSDTLGFEQTIGSLWKDTDNDGVMDTVSLPFQTPDSIVDWTKAMKYYSYRQKAFIQGTDVNYFVINNDLLLCQD